MNIEKEEIKKNSLAIVPLWVKILSLLLPAVIMVLLIYFFFFNSSAQLNDSANDILNSKIQRIAFLKQEEEADKKKIEELKREIAARKQTLKNIAIALNSINSTSVVSVQQSRKKIYAMLKNANNPQVIIANNLVTTPNTTISQVQTENIKAKKAKAKKAKNKTTDKIKIIKKEAYNINF